MGPDFHTKAMIHLAQLGGNTRTALTTSWDLLGSVSQDSKCFVDTTGFRTLMQVTNWLHKALTSQVEFLSKLDIIWVDILWHIRQNTNISLLTTNWQPSDVLWLFPGTRKASLHLRVDSALGQRALSHRTVKLDVIQIWVHLGRTSKTEHWYEILADFFKWAEKLRGCYHYFKPIVQVLKVFCGSVLTPDQFFHIWCTSSSDHQCSLWFL